MTTAESSPSDEAGVDEPSELASVVAKGEASPFVEVGELNERRGAVKRKKMSASTYASTQMQIRETRACQLAGSTSGHSLTA